MSHDIRTPINGICGMVNMAEHYADDMEKQTEYRTKVKEASNLLLELVNDVLDMSKLESGEVVLEESPFNLSKIFEEVLVVIEQIAAEQNIRIVWEKKEIKHRDLIGSPRYVKRVMMNILSNAVKYNRENGQIYISCREIPSEQPEMTIMEFVCRDTGIGMTDEFQKHIFEPFAQEHTGSRTKFAGTGLGMPITKKLVEKMGGTVTFESEKGVGTTFVIRVPFKIDPDADKREEQKEVSEKSIKGLHILLAEDNELNMEIAEFMLQNEGADVSKAWNGQEAVELFRNSEPGEFDVILMDIMMPIMDGYEAAKMIRSLDREDAKTIPIIAMTANAFTEDRIRAKEAGMDEHISKPVDGNFTIIYKWTNGKWLVQHLHYSTPDLEQMDGEEFPLTLGKQVKKTRQALHALGTVVQDYRRYFLQELRIIRLRWNTLFQMSMSALKIVSLCSNNRQKVKIRRSL